MNNTSPANHQPASASAAESFPTFSDSLGLCGDIWADLLTNSPAPPRFARHVLALIATALLSSGFHALLLYRIGRRCARLKLFPLTLVIEKIIYHWYHCALSCRAEIGPGVWLPHPLGIVIGRGARLGAGVKLFQNVQLLGNIAKPGRSAVPLVGDLVWLAPGAMVVGVSVGNETFVAAGAVVTKDAPWRCMAAGVPASFRPLSEAQRKHTWDWQTRKPRRILQGQLPEQVPPQ